MPELTLHDIDQISHDVRRQEITFSHLLDELIDHVCCDVEYEMKKGKSFSEAYLSVKRQMGPRRLKEIQEETLYAVDTKYRKMKNTMKISGIAGSVLLGFAAVFKILHYPGAGVLLTLGATLLALLFMPSALVVLWKETHSRKRLFLFVSAFLAGSTFIAGILFKIQHWPSANILLSLAVLFAILLFLPSLLIGKLSDNENINKRPVYITGFIAMIIYIGGFWFKMMHWPFAGFLIIIGSVMLLMVVLPWYTWKTWKDETQVSTKFIFMILTLLAFLMPGALVNQGSTQKMYDEEFFVQMDQQRAMVSYRETSEESLLNLFKDSVQYKRMAKIYSERMKLFSHIDQLEAMMVKMAEGKSGVPAENPEQISVNEGKMSIQYRKLSDSFNRESVPALLIPGTVSRKELDVSLAQYRDSLSVIISAEWIKKFESLLNSSLYLPGEDTDYGEFALINGLHALTLLKDGILISESEAFRYITRH
jgi:hypothetical protein